MRITDDDIQGIAAILTLLVLIVLVILVAWLLSGGRL